MPRMRGPCHQKMQQRQIGLLFFPAGVALFDPKNPAGRIYLLRSGYVQLSRASGEIVAYLAPGDFFGEKSFLAPLRRGQVAKTLSPATVLAFRKSELLDRLSGDRGFATKVVKNLALRLDRCEEGLGDFVRAPAERRLALLLWRITPDRAVSGLARLPFDLTNNQLAHAIGTTRWRVSHFIGHFQQLGWLRRRQGLWIDREKLGEFLKAA